MNTSSHISAIYISLYNYSFTDDLCWVVIVIFSSFYLWSKECSWRWCKVKISYVIRIWCKWWNAYYEYQAYCEERRKFVSQHGRMTNFGFPIEMNFKCSFGVLNNDRLFGGCRLIFFIAFCLFEMISDKVHSTSWRKRERRLLLVAMKFEQVHDDFDWRTYEVLTLFL